MTYLLIKAEKQHLDQAASLMMFTGYWDAGLKCNKLGVTSEICMRDYIAPLYLPFMTVVVEASCKDKVLGVIVAGPSNDITSIQFDKENPIDPKIMIHFKNLADFQVPYSYHISFLAVNKSYRRQGIGRLMLNYAEDFANQSGFEVLSLYTSNYQISSIQLYLSFGMMIKKVITLSELFPAPYMLYFEKSDELEKKRDYFETREYKNLDLFTLEY